MTINDDVASEVGVILPVENKILPIIHLTLKLTKKHPLFYNFVEFSHSQMRLSHKTSIKDIFNELKTLLEAVL